MRNLRLLVLFLLISFVSSAQNFHIGFFGGISNYQGDLVDGIFATKQTKVAFGISGSYEFTDNLMLRAGFTYGKVGGADRYSKSEELRLRNLSFESAITELSLLGEYYAFNLYTRRYSPYFFAGLALYHFNPYTFDSNNQQVFLKPLSTEGQGLANYPNRRPYSLIQLSIPFGGGIKFAINDNIRIGLELGLRKLFTDYIDDVSTTYVDEFDLLTAKGPKAVDLSYRGDEVLGGDPFYPTKFDTRGGEKIKDYYYFTGLHITFRLPESKKTFGSKASHGRGTKRGKYGCPSVPL